MPYTLPDLLTPEQSILVFGRDGQVGKALQSLLNRLKLPVSILFLSRVDCDLSNESSIVDILNRYQPKIIINAAAYTAVDEAEKSGERDVVFAINAVAPELMARYMAGVDNGVFIHYSTDYVFADTKKTEYFESDPVGPIGDLSVYGQSKLAGEREIRKIFDKAHGIYQANDIDKAPRYFILRTSWVYGDGANFICKILRLADESDQLKVVSDQVGTPTSAQWLAEITIRMVGSRLESGIYHVVPDGEVSWHGLAVFAIETAASYGARVNVGAKSIIPTLSFDYPQSAKRPYNSRLSNQKLKKSLTVSALNEQYPSWQQQVNFFIKKVIGGSLQDEL